MKIYVYQDNDNGIVEVFDSLKKAKVFSEEIWGDSDYEEAEDGTSWYDNHSDYAMIYLKEVK